MTRHSAIGRSHFRAGAAFAPLMVLALALGAALGAGAQPAADDAVAEIPLLEALPHHLALRVAQIDPAANATELGRSRDELAQLQWIYQKSVLWIPGSTLRICFVGGNDALNARIVSAAAEWSRHANLRFDAGPVAARPTRCTTADQSEIRIGFAYRGYWSLLGQTSIDFSVVGPGEQSMNFGGWDVRPPTPAELRRVVLHEFGHALGLHHEHQNQGGGCDAEFDFDRLYVELAKPPNEWSRETVDLNLRAIPDSAMIERSGHDRLSIMHYAFAPWFFKRGTESPCYVAPNMTISQKDIEGVRTAYPGQDVAEIVEARVEAIAAAARTLEPNQEPAAKRIGSELGKRALAIERSAAQLY